MEIVSYMKNNTTPKTPHQQLLEKLDDTDFAREFFTEKQKEAEELIAQILMVTSGVCHSQREDGAAEWGEKNVRAYNNQTGLDYICLGVFESEEIANEMANAFERNKEKSIT
jgi:hypothetical protein